MRIPLWLRAFRAIVRLAVWVFFRRIEVSGLEHIPPKGGVIFAPNHQNAFMDALLTLYGMERLPFFLARADIFKSAFFAQLLYAIRILPIYRKRDGQREVARNHEVFERCGALLSKGESLLIFPEANHHPSFQLRPLQKGLARLALEAAAQNGFEQEIRIVPVGITYEDFPRFRQQTYVVYGAPIALSGYREIFEAHPQTAIQQLREDLTERLEPLVLNLQPAARYEVLDRLRRVLRPVVVRRMGLEQGPRSDFQADKACLTTLESLSDGEFAQAASALGHYEAVLRKAGIRPLGPIPETWARPVWMRRFLAWLLLLPVALYAWVNHLPLAVLTGWGVRRWVRDPGFHASIKLVAGLVAVPLFYTLQTLWVWKWSHSSQWALIYLFSLPLSAAAWLYARRLGKALRDQGQWRAFALQQPDLFAELRQWHGQLQRALRYLA